MAESESQNVFCLNVYQSCHLSLALPVLCLAVPIVSLAVPIVSLAVPSLSLAYLASYQTVPV